MKIQTAFSRTVQRADEIFLYAIAMIVAVFVLSFLERKSIDPEALVFVFVFALFLFFVGFWFGEIIRKGQQKSPKTSFKTKAFEILGWGVSFALALAGLRFIFRYILAFSAYMGWS